MGGWGLKNPHCFAKALAAKGIWRLIKGVCLWEKVITHKLIKPLTVEERIQKRDKIIKMSLVCGNM